MKMILELKNVSQDLVDFLIKAVDKCVSQIESGALEFERHLGDFEDVNKIKDDKELLDLLDVRIIYISKLRNYYWLYENNYNRNSNVFNLVSTYFDNNVFEKFHYSTCKNINIEDSLNWEEDCGCYDDFYNSVAYHVSEIVNKRYEEVCDLEEEYKDLHYYVSERVENLEDEEENKEND